MTKRGSTALSTCVAPCSRASSVTAAADDASTWAATNLPPTTSRPAAAVTVRSARARSWSARTMSSKKLRPAAIRATASPTPPLPTTRMRTTPPSRPRASPGVLAPGQAARPPENVSLERRTRALGSIVDPGRSYGGATPDPAVVAGRSRAVRRRALRGRQHLPHAPQDGQHRQRDERDDHDLDHGRQEGPRLLRAAGSAGARQAPRPGRLVQRARDVRHDAHEAPREARGHVLPGREPRRDRGHAPRARLTRLTRAGRAACGEPPRRAARPRRAAARGRT